jgi:1-acyl-sn-glycerol-3-phosphate acyltransferase
MFRALMTSRRSGESPSILVFSLRALWRVLFRLEVAGWENLVSAGAPNIVVVDHVSWLEAPILFSLMETPATFVIEPAAAKSWAQRLFLRFADTRLLDHDRPLDSRALVREARQGQLCGPCESAQRQRSVTAEAVLAGEQMADLFRPRRHARFATAK